MGIPGWLRGRKRSRLLLLVRSLLFFGGVLLFGRVLDAQWSPSPPVDTAPEATPFSSGASPLWANRGRWTFGAQVGLALENAIPRNISHVNLFIIQPQLGFIVRDFDARRFPVRRFEIINEGILGNAIHPGGRLTGYALLFRLDGKNHRRIVPFMDAGAGVQSTNLNTRAPELSGKFQFSPQGGFGVQYFFNPQRAFILEYRYMHMSNAGIEEPNHGFNACMLSIGFRWLRRPRPMAWEHPRHSRNPLRFLFGTD